MNTKLKWLILPVMVVIAVLLTGCEPGPEVIYCPKDYAQSEHECKVGGFEPKWEYDKHSALTLKDGQAAVHIPPGDRPIVVVEGAGRKAIPKEHTVVYNTVRINTVRTVADMGECDANQEKSQECIVPSRVFIRELTNGTDMVVAPQYQIRFKTVVNPETATLLLELGDYQGLVDELHVYLDRLFNEVYEEDPTLFYPENANERFTPELAERFAEWKYSQVVDITDFWASVSQVRIELVDEELEAAEAFKALEDVVCRGTESEMACVAKLDVFLEYLGYGQASMTLPIEITPIPTEAAEASGE